MPGTPAPALPPYVDRTVDSRPAPTTAYERALHDILDALFAAYPTLATNVGLHRYDDRWPDLGPAGRERRLAVLHRARERVEGSEEAQLEAGERFDRGILLDALEGMLFEEEVLEEEAWDPLAVVGLLGGGLFALLGREFAPWEQRGTAFAWRVAGIGEVLEAGLANLVGRSGRPVSLLHTETALAQLAGIPELIDEGLAEAVRRRDAGEADLVAAIESVRPVALAAVERFRAGLDGPVRERAAGEGRLGEELFAAKLQQTLSSDISPAELEAQAHRDYDLVREEMRRLAAGLWATWWPDEPLPEGVDPVVRRVLDRIAEQHRQPEELLDHCRGLIGELEAFVRQHAVLGLPDEPLRVTWTPTFQRAHGGAFLAPPGPLEQGQASYFWITPPGDDWPPERVESYLREDNDRMLRLLCIHEAVPGHYVQLAWGNRCPSLTRAVFADGKFAEGWAVYITQVMMDLGYGADDPALLLTHWKFYLRSITNALIDVGIHARGMTEEEALRLMIEGGFQEEQEARAKWLRARLSSTQLSTYYLGSLEMWDLELEARRRAASAAGASAEAVPTPRVVGGLGASPGFDQRRHLEAVLSHGTPPIRWVRRILFDEPGDPAGD
ncbi:MAG TPA: DUF885 domain-containing protein [Candidatus Limnocylindrales bacterium]|nr:DUF885 domain-containing protein [Candidatus Limnocylindrales bacterium]